jgi:uncharacterized membrane protein
MVAPGCLSLLMIVGLFLLPFFYANLMIAAMAKLGLSPAAALWTIGGVILGSLINIPIRKIERPKHVDYSTLHMFGLHRLVPSAGRSNPYTIIAINVGGFLIPTMVTFYQIARIAQRGPWITISLLVVSTVNIVVCYRLARPTPGVGITMPPLIPPLIAATGALILAPDFAPPLAFSAGVLGPVIGADLMHMKDINQLSTGIASIGGAGTFDGIVLSGIIAAFLA